MAQATSPASDQRYGIRRVCQAWGVPRSSFYAAAVMDLAAALGGEAPQVLPPHPPARP